MHHLPKPEQGGGSLGRRSLLAACLLAAGIPASGQVGPTIRLIKPFPDTAAAEGARIIYPTRPHLLNETEWDMRVTAYAENPKFGIVPVHVEGPDSALVLVLGQPDYAWGDFQVVLRATHYGPLPRDTVRDTFTVSLAQDFDDLILRRDSLFRTAEETPARIRLDTLFHDWDDLHPYAFRLLQAHPALGARLAGDTLIVDPAKDRYGMFENAVEVRNTRGFQDTFSLMMDVWNVNDSPVLLAGRADTAIHVFDTLPIVPSRHFADADSGSPLGIKQYRVLPEPREAMTFCCEQGEYGQMPVPGFDRVRLLVSALDDGPTPASFSFEVRTDAPMPLGKQLGLPLSFLPLTYLPFDFWNFPGPEPLLILKSQDRLMVLDGEGRLARNQSDRIYTTYGEGVYPISDGVLITLTPQAPGGSRDTILALRRRNGAWSEERFPVAPLGIVHQVFEAGGRPVILRHQRSRINGPAYSYLDTNAQATDVSMMLPLPLPEGAQAHRFLPRQGGYHVVWSTRPSADRPDSLFLSAADAGYRFLGAPLFLAAGSRCGADSCLSSGILFKQAGIVDGSLEILWTQAGNLYRTALNTDLSPRQVRQQLSRFHVHPGESIILKGAFRSGPGLREIHWYGNHEGCMTHHTRIVLDTETGDIVRGEESQVNTRCANGSGTSAVERPIPFGNGYSLVIREETGALPSIRRERTGDWAPVGVIRPELPARSGPRRTGRLDMPGIDALGRKRPPRRAPWPPAR